MKIYFFFFQAEDGIRDADVTGVQTCALPISDLRKRLHAAIGLKFSQFAEHRRLLIALVRIGIDPKHPLSPFGRETAPLREESIDAFRDALEGANVKIPKELRAELPNLLWLYQ